MDYNREEAWALLSEHVHSEALVQHALAVEAVMRRFARAFGEDEQRYGIIGLLHDLDYEEFPEEHCQHTGAMMREAGYSEADIRAVLSHGYTLCTDVEPIEKIEKTLFTIDELTGLVAATALMRPSKSVMDLEVKSLKKKWKTRAFAAGCDRDLIQKGCDMLGMSLEEVMQLTIEGMRDLEQGQKG